MDIEKQIKNICETINKLTEDEYKKNNFVPHKTSAKNRKEPKESTMEMNQLRSKMFEIQKNKQSDRKNDNSNVSVMNDINNDNFNIVSNEKEYKEWRKLTIDEKIDLLNKYLSVKYTKNIN